MLIEFRLIMSRVIAIDGVVNKKGVELWPPATDNQWVND